jgi:spore germination protein
MIIDYFKLFLKTTAFIFTGFCLVISNPIFALENLVYTWRGFPTEIAQGTTALNDLKQHIKKIDILSSQAYHINEKGTVYGEENPQMLKIARDANLKIMPLVGNSHFDRDKTHLFLHDAAAMKRALQALLKLCDENHFYGLQIDFEGMSFLDRDAFTSFYQQVAEMLHQHGYQVSIAIIPAITDTLSTEYLKGRHEGWSGVYDYVALGKVSDFVTLMAYDQHDGPTTPGPMAGLTWDEAIVKYALRFIPAEKLSLGIPWHSGYW